MSTSTVNSERTGVSTGTDSTSRGQTQSGSRSNNNNNTNRNRNNSNGTTFTGDIPDMNGYIFSTNRGTNPKHDITKTLDVLKTYVTQKCKSPRAMMTLFATTPVNPVADKPEDLDSADKADEIKRSIYMIEYKE